MQCRDPCEPSGLPSGRIHYVELYTITDIHPFLTCSEWILHRIQANLSSLEGWDQNKTIKALALGAKDSVIKVGNILTQYFKNQSHWALALSQKPMMNKISTSQKKTGSPSALGMTHLLLSPILALLFTLFQQPHLQNGIPVVDLFARRVGVRVKQNNKSISMFINERALGRMASSIKVMHNVKLLHWQCHP